MELPISLEAILVKLYTEPWHCRPLLLREGVERAVISSVPWDMGLPPDACVCVAGRDQDNISPAVAGKRPAIAAPVQ